MTKKEPEFRLPTGVTTWVPGTNLRACLEMAVGIWLNEYPQEVKDFAWDIRQKRDVLNKASGMFRGGNMKEYLEVPVRLGSLIAQMTNKDWMLDKQICEMIRQLIPDLLPYKGKDESRAFMNKKVII